MTTREQRERTLWLQVSMDEYELPLIVADSAAELASLAGVSVQTVRTAACIADKPGSRQKYIRVIFDTKEELLCD